MRNVFIKITARNYSNNYVCLFENFEELQIHVFQNGKLVKQKTFAISELDWKKYLKKYSNFPTYIIAKGFEAEFKEISIAKLNFWDRILMINQIRNSESSDTNLVNYYKPSSVSEKSYTLVEINSSLNLNSVYHEFVSLPNVLAGVQSFELEVSRKMLETASVDYTLHDLRICVIANSEKEFVLIVFDGDKLLLQRQVYVVAADIESEIKATLNFLKRHSYKNDQQVSVLIPEYILKNIKLLQTHIEFLTIANRVFDKENYNPKKPFMNFVPKCLKESYFAYLLPIFAVKYILPLVGLFVILGAMLQIQSSFQDSDNKILLAKYDDIANQIPSDINIQLHMAKQFKEYTNSVYANPSLAFSKLNKNLLRLKQPASLVSWQIFPDQTFELRLQFANVSKNKMNALRKNIEHEYQKIWGEASINWEESEHNIILLIKGRNTDD